MALAISIFANVALLAGVAYLLAYDPVVATITTPNGMVRTVLAGVVNQELAKRHGEEVQSDLVGRALIDLAAEESNIELDQQELESRWQDWLAEPGTRARIDSGEITEGELRDRLVTLVLLDQLSWNELTAKEQEAAMEEFFKTNQQDFEQLRLRHIVVESQKDAVDIANRLAAGVDFQELAKRFSLDPLTRDQGGDMGWKSRADLTEDLRSFLFLLPTGAASTPVSSASGWHIFLVEERREDYEDCKVQVRREIMRRLRPETLDQLRERFKVERSEGSSLLEKLKRPGYLQGSQQRAFHQPAQTKPTPQSDSQPSPQAPDVSGPLDPGGLPPVEPEKPLGPKGAPVKAPPGPLQPLGPTGQPGQSSRQGAPSSDLPRLKGTFVPSREPSDVSPPPSLGPTNRVQLAPTP
jgi:parvulin-like peptidyl-prolyl isomerase